MMKAHSITGFMKEMIKTYGCSHKKCGDGLNSKMVHMYSLPISQKQDGTIFQTVDLMLSKTPDKVSTIQNTSTITTFTLMSMLIQEQLGELREPVLGNISQKVNSMTKADGEIHKMKAIIEELR